MIIDSHVYCFEPATSPAGHASGEEHMRWLQLAHAAHHQPAIRIRDRSPGPSAPLNPSGRWDPAAAPDVDFRINSARGRVVWNHEGEEYTKHFYPPDMGELDYTHFSLTCEMDYAGVDMALLHVDPILGRDSAFQAACVERFPDRLRSMAPVDEWRIPSETDAVIGQLQRAIGELGLHAVKFCPPHAYLGHSEPWDDGPFRPFWEAAAGLGVPIFFTLGSGPAGMAGEKHPGGPRQEYLDELRILTRWMERYPGTVCSLTHGFPWRLFLEGGRIVLPEEVWEPFAGPSCHLEVCFPVRLGDLFDFPYREVWPTLEEMVARVGSDRLLWGTDMPFQNRFCTYRQSRRWIEHYCDFLTTEDKDAIMGRTAARILGIETEGGRV